MILEAYFLDPVRHLIRIVQSETAIVQSEMVWRASAAYQIRFVQMSLDMKACDLSQVTHMDEAVPFVPP